MTTQKHILLTSPLFYLYTYHWELIKSLVSLHPDIKFSVLSYRNREKLDDPGLPPNINVIEVPGVTVLKDQFVLPN